MCFAHPCCIVCRKISGEDTEDASLYGLIQDVSTTAHMDNVVGVCELAEVCIVIMHAFQTLAHLGY